ncbi:MAG: lysophospholipid acyltransferase family protein [Candidatus Omnitrophota bacterium]
MKIKTRRYYIYYLIRVAFFLLGLIPLKIGLFIADVLGRMAFSFLKKYRETAVSNLDDVFGNDHQSNLEITEGVFRNFAKNGAEWIKLSSMDPGKISSIVTEDEGFEHLDAVLSEGNGAVVLGFHFGNWELLGLYSRYKGYPGTLVARRIYFHKYDKIISRMRQRFDAPVIYRDESPKKMLKVLKSGNILGIVPDQDVDSIDGIFVDFFGKPAFTPVAPVKIAMAAKTKIVPIFVVRKKDNTHKVVVEKPIDPSSGGRDKEDIKRYTQQWSSLLEKYVRQYPEQWVWIHERWKTKMEKEEKVAVHSSRGSENA